LPERDAGPDHDGGLDQDLALLVEAAYRAGRIALQFWGNNPRVHDKGDGQGPVTEADLAVNDMLETTLRAARPGYGWLSEETPDDPARLSCENVFIIDPIDGTRAFIDKDAGFSHSLAIARNGHVTAAAVYLPAKDRLYTARSRRPAHRDSAPIRASQRDDPEGARLMTSKGNLDPEHWIGPPPTVQRVFRPSIASRLCLVADGGADGLLTLRPTWEWDIAAGSLIATRAGATVTDRHGAAPLFNRLQPQSDGLLVAPAALHAAVLARLRPDAGFQLAQISHGGPGV